jgi:fatty-acid desaturase
MKNIFASSILGVQIFLLFSFILTIYGFYSYHINLNTAILVIAGYFIYGCLGIVVTFHRHLTHKSFKTSKHLVKLFSIFGCLAGTGSPMSWVAIHINHHLRSDKETDPHSPHYKGIKIFALNYSNEIDDLTKWRMRDLVTDKFHQFLHRYYFLVLLSWGVILYFVAGLYLTIFFFLTPALLTALMSNVVNYVGHKPQWIGGSRRYQLADYSANNWLWAIPSWGESWHNNHHRYPKRFSLGEKWWEIDISAMVIRLIKKSS